MCSRCKSNSWNCISCKIEITREEFYDTFKENKQSPVAVYCNCCDHNFVCQECYNKNPGYKYWKAIFGNSHNIFDVISKESDLSNTLLNVVNGYKKNNQVQIQPESNLIQYKFIFFIIVAIIMFVLIK